MKSYLIAGALALTLVICGCSEKHDAEDVYKRQIYDTLEEIEDDFEDYAHNTDYCRKVLDKWVFVIA